MGRSLTAVAVVEDLEIFEDRVGELDPRCLARVPQMFDRLELQKCL
jgi:hypothetical protein